MHSAPSTSTWAIALVGLLLVSSMGIVDARSSRTPPTGPGEPASGLAPSTPLFAPPESVHARAPEQRPAPPTGISHGPPMLASEALATARGAGIPSKFVFLPGAPANPEQQRATVSSGHVLPTICPSCTAPMGIGDYGLRTAPNGSVLPYVLNTASLEGTMDVNATGIQPLYILDSSPDAYSIQLNAVLTNVTLLGNSSYQFWTQSVALYFAQSHVLYLLSNVWNFSSDLLTPNTISSHGPNGKLVGDVFYMSVVRFTGVTYPFNLTLFLNSTVLNASDAVNFAAVVSTGSATISDRFDYVVFNSTLGGVGVAGPAGYTANGFRYNPVGRTDDFEFVLGGPGGGSQVNLFEAQATLSLRYWNVSTGAYQPVPSALSYGSDSGESASGANIEWTNGSAGPYALVSTGPSILTGLWNASGSAGVATIQTQVAPTNAFVFLQPTTGTFTTSEPEWAPTLRTASLSVSPGTYDATALLSFYAPFNATLADLRAGTVRSFAPALVPSVATGVTTPLWVWNNSQFAAISASGSGTPASPYMVDDQQSGPMAGVFGTMNDYTFPVFSGVFFVGTSASAELFDPGTFATRLPNPSPALPTTDDLPYTFYGASNVSVIGGKNISGWYTYDLLAGAPEFATFNMVFWNSSHNLIALNTFNTQSEGIYLYGGTANTIWNNTIRWGKAPGSGSVPLWPEGSSVGIQEGENGDLIFDNALYTATTASTPRLDMYTGAHQNFTDTWNVTNSSLTTVRYAAGFPNIPLYGSIVNTSYEGGNFWWDYGLPSNPYGRLPYNESGQIVQGGDYVPLVPHFLVTFLATGHVGSGSWAVNLSAPDQGSQLGISVTNEVVFPYLRDDAYTYLVEPPLGFYSAPASGLFDLFGSVTIPVFFHSDNGTLAGIIFPPNATFVVNGSSVPLAPSGAYNVTLAPGSYAVVASAPFYQANHTNVSITSNHRTFLNISLTLGAVNGTVQGQISPATAAVTIGGTVVPVNATGGFGVTLPPGSYMIAGSATGFASEYQNITVTSHQTTFVNLTLSPLPAGSKGLSALDYGILGIVAVVGILLLVVARIRSRGGPPPPEPATGATTPAEPPAAAGVPPGSGGS